jgi:hypothetical protein
VATSQTKKLVFYTGLRDLMVPDSSVDIVIRLCPGWLRSRGSIVDSYRDVSLFTASRPLLGPTQPPVQWVLSGDFPRG